MDSPEYLAAMRVLTDADIRYFLKRLNMPAEPEDMHNRHQDYLPLNLWDETLDE